MGGLGLGNLPPLPSAAAGIPQVNPLAQLLQAVGQFPQQKREAQYQDQERQAQVEERKAQADARKKQAAKFGYDNLVQMAQNAPGIAKNPEFVNKFTEHATALGLPVPRAADGSFDVGALQPKKDIWDTPALLEHFNELPREQKQAMYASGRVSGITPDMVDKDPIVAPGSATWQRLQNQVGAVLKRAEDGGMTAEQFATEWDRLKTAREPLGMFGDPPASATAGLGRAIQAKVQALEAGGAAISARAKAALDNAKSLNDYRKAEIQLIGIKGREIPMMDQAKIAHWKATEQAAQQNIAVRRDNLARLKQQTATLGPKYAGMLMAERHRLFDETKSTRSQLESLEKSLLLADTNNADKTSQSYQDLLSSVKSLRAQLQAQDSTLQEFSQGASPAISGYLSKMTGKKVNDVTKGSMNDQGAGVVPTGAVRGTVHTKSGDMDGYQLNGKNYTMDGKLVP